MGEATPRREVWIGLATVHQRPGAGILMDENDAFVPMLAWARSSAEFASEIAKAFNDYGFDVLDLESVEALSERLQHSTVEASLLEKATEVEETKLPRFGSFVTWLSDG